VRRAAAPAPRGWGRLDGPRGPRGEPGTGGVARERHGQAPVAKGAALRQWARPGTPPAAVWGHGAIEGDPSGRQPRGAGVAVGRAALAAESQRAGGVLPAARRASGAGAGQHGAGVQPGAARVGAVETRDSRRGAGAGSVGDGLPGAGGALGKAEGGGAGRDSGRARSSGATVVRRTGGEPGAEGLGR
jgi:hypothetical protein